MAVFNSDYGNFMADKLFELASRDGFTEMYDISVQQDVQTMDGLIKLYPWCRYVHISQKIDLTGRTDIPQGNLRKTFDNHGVDKGPWFLEVAACPSQTEKYDMLKDILSTQYFRQQEMLKRGLKISQPYSFKQDIAVLLRYIFKVDKQVYTTRLIDTMLKHTR